MLPCESVEMIQSSFVVFLNTGSTPSSKGINVFIFFPLQAVEELFALLRLFAGVTCDPSREKTKEEEAFEAAFRKDTIALYQSVLDPGASWTTLIRYKYIILYISTLLRFSPLSREHLPKMDT